MPHDQSTRLLTARGGWRTEFKPFRKLPNGINSVLRRFWIPASQA
jgi:hypothetical protein